MSATAFYQQEELEDLIEVETLYATYAHDPKTGAESPRAIIEDGDLLRISITDSGRDRRDPVLITAPAARLSLTMISKRSPVVVDTANADESLWRLLDKAETAETDTMVPNARAIIGDALGLSADQEMVDGSTRRVLHIPIFQILNKL